MVEFLVTISLLAAAFGLWSIGYMLGIRDGARHQKTVDSHEAVRKNAAYWAPDDKNGHALRWFNDEAKQDT